MFDELKDKNLDKTLAKLFIGWSIAYNDGPSFMTDEARERSQYVVKKTLPPFIAPNGKSVWEGSTPFEALGKAMTDFSECSGKADDSMDYDEDTILDASAVLNSLRNVNLDGGFNLVNNHLKAMIEKYEGDCFNDVKQHFNNFVFLTSEGANDFKVIKENDVFIDWLINEVINENYTLAHHIIKNEPKNK